MIKKAEKLNWEKLKLYQGLPQQLQENAKNITGLVYYDLACYQALQGKKKAALKNFEKAFNSRLKCFRNCTRLLSLGFI